MPGDFNPDKERHVDHKYMVVKATKDPSVTGVKVGDKEFKFGKQGWFRVPGDPGLAADLREAAGYDATVSRVRAPSPVSDRGHKFFFGQMPRMPWHKYDEQGNRIKE